MKSLLSSLLTAITITSTIPIANLVHSTTETSNKSVIRQTSNYEYSKTFSGGFKLDGAGIHDISEFKDIINEIWNFVNDKTTNIGDFSVTSWKGVLITLQGEKSIPYSSIQLLTKLLKQNHQPVITQTQSNIEQFTEDSYTMSLISWVELNGNTTAMNINGYSESQLFNENQMNSGYTYNITIGYNKAQPQKITSELGIAQMGLIPNVKLSAPQDLLNQGKIIAEKYQGFKITQLNMILNDQNGNKFGCKIEPDLINFLNLKIYEKSNFNEKDYISGQPNILTGTVFYLNYYVNNKLEKMKIGTLSIIPVGEYTFKLNATLDRN